MISDEFQRFLGKLLFVIRNPYRKHEKTEKQKERTKFAKLHFGETKMNLIYSHFVSRARASMHSAREICWFV